MKQIAAASVIFLMACSAPNQNQTPQKEATASTPAPEAVSGCRRIADLFDELVRRKSEGMIEDEALAMLSDRGDYSLGYVVDGVYGNRYGTGGSPSARVDVLAACRNLEKGNPLY